MGRPRSDPEKCSEHHWEAMVAFLRSLRTGFRVAQGRRQLRAAVARPNFPAGHGTQEASPVAAAYLPSGQSWQASSWLSLSSVVDLPTAHSEQDVYPGTPFVAA